MPLALRAALTARITLSALALVASAAARGQAVEPTVPDTMAQRALACTGCHGPQGRSSPTGYIPRIAGKPAGYLHEQLLNFREGRRAQAAMAGLLENLSDEFMRSLATHFASVQVPYPKPPAPARPASPTAEADARRAAFLVRQGDATRGVPACAGCHGEALTGVAPQVPGLLGLPADYLIAQLGAWRIGKRQARAPDCMATIAQGLSVDDIALLARWLQAQPVPATGRAVDALPGPAALPCGSLLR